MQRGIAIAFAAVLGMGACAPRAPVAAPDPAVATALPGAARGVETITAQDMYARIAFLASDALRGRDTPSPGLDAAAAYLVSEYIRIGLEPAGENGTFYQHYPFPLRRQAVSTTRLNVASAAGTRTLQFGRDFYTTGGTRAEVTAPAVRIPAGGDTAANLPEIRNRVAVFELPGGNNRDFRLQRTRQARLAERSGAAAVVHVLDPAWTADSIARYSANSGRAGRALGADVPFPQVLVTRAAYQRAFGTGPVSVALTVPVEDVDRATAPNVVAVLRGSDPALRDEYVVLSSHMDHVGVGTPVNGDSIYNGADDDASGTAALVEVAEAIASLPVRPKRSIVFLHVSGEEKGLLGSRWYSDHPTVPLEQIVANINVDMIGRNSPDTVVVIGKNYSTLGRSMNQVGARHPELRLAAADDIWPEERFFFRSDHFNFARKEIPALFFFTGVHPDYHRPSDEVGKIDTDKAMRVARLIFYTVTDIADAPTRPTWDPQGLAEVRALTR